MSYRQVLGWRDVFGDLNFKPWWESFRSYTLVVMSAGTLFYAYSSSEGPIVCVPTTDACNSSTALVFSNAESTFTNNKCISTFTLGWLLSNYWWLSALATAVLFAANNFWEYNTTLVTAIRELKAFYDAFDEIDNYEEKVMFDLVSTPGELTEEKKKAGDVWKGFLYNEKSNVGQWFCLRNVVSLLVAGACFGGMISQFVLVLDADPEFDCTVERPRGSFVCLYTVHSIILPVIAINIVMSFVQCLIFIILLCKIRNPNNIDLFLQYVNQSGVGKSGSHNSFEKVREYVQERKQQLLKEMGSPAELMQFFKAIELEDEEFFQIYKLAARDYKELLGKLKDEFVRGQKRDGELKENFERMKGRLTQIAKSKTYTLRAFALERTARPPHLLPPASATLNRKGAFSFTPKRRSASLASLSSDRRNPVSETSIAVELAQRSTEFKSPTTAETP